MVHCYFTRLNLKKWDYSLSRNKKDLNDVIATPFSVSFPQLPAAKKHTENGVTVTSLRSFLFRDDFRRENYPFLRFILVK